MMIADFNKLIVLENDNREVPYHMDMCLKQSPVINTEYWYNFSISFHWDRVAAFKRLQNSEGVLFVGAPSFVGAGNSINGYILLLLELKEMGTKINLALISSEHEINGMRIELLEYLDGGAGLENISKKTAKKEMLTELLDWHNIYEIPYNGGLAASLDEATQITTEEIFKYYIEKHPKARDMFETPNGVIGPVIGVNYRPDLDDSDISIMVSESPFKQEIFKFKELKRV